MISKCPVCKKQKAKRVCPLFEKTICPRCCFQERNNNRNCPETCRYLQKSKQLERQKEIEYNKSYYAGLTREFANSPDLYVPLIQKVTEKIAELASKDGFLEDVHVLEGLYRNFNYLKARVEEIEYNRDVLLNRIGSVQTGVEESIFQYKIDNKMFTDKQVLISLNQIIINSEKEISQTNDPKHLISIYKEMNQKNDKEDDSGIIIPGGRQK